MGNAWLIASGKGGVGKSTIASALGHALADSGALVCIVDADIGLRDQDAILGVENQVVYDVVDVADRACGLSQALIQVSERLELLPAAQFARVKDLDGKSFRRIVDRLKKDHDYVLIDCPAGIERGLRGAMKCQPDGALVITTPDDVCIRNAERLASLLREQEILTQVIVNRLQSDLIRCGTMYSAATVAQVLELPLAGEVPEDPEVYRSLLNHQSFMKLDTPASVAIKRIAARFRGESASFPNYGSEIIPWYKRLFCRKEARRS